VVLVSHDRHLLRVVADELLLVHAGSVAPFDGDLEDYARWLASSGGAAPDGAKAAAAGAAGSPRAGAAPGPQVARGTHEARKQRKRAQAQRRAALGPLRVALAAQERELERLLATRSQIEQQLAVPAPSV